MLQRVEWAACMLVLVYLRSILQSIPRQVYKDIMPSKQEEEFDQDKVFHSGCVINDYQAPETSVTREILYQSSDISTKLC